MGALMNSPFRNIPRSGDDVRNLRGWLEDLGRGSGGQSDTMRVSSGIADLRGRPRRMMGDAGTVATRYVIQEVFGDYVTAYPCGENGAADPSAELVSIAKGKDLRQSYWNGQTLNGWSYAVQSGDPNFRRATRSSAVGFSAGAVLDEEIVPAYAANKEIYALDTNITTGITDAGAGAVTHIEVSPTRVFMAKRIQLSVCEDVGGIPTPKKIVLLGGPTFV
jgi:hypothetical protein